MLGVTIQVVLSYIKSLLVIDMIRFSENPTVMKNNAPVEGAGAAVVADISG